MSEASLAALLLTNRLVDVDAKPLSAGEYWALIAKVPDPGSLLGIDERAVADLLGGQAADVVVSSTGVIGVPLPVERLLSALPGVVASLSSTGGAAAARAIMTTDTVAKEWAVEGDIGARKFVVGGMAKGSGMIAPNMATMLSVLTTDAPLTGAACDVALRKAVGATFNRVTVDTDTSTNDMVVLMASGAAGGAPIGPDSPDFAPYRRAARAFQKAHMKQLAALAGGNLRPGRTGPPG